MSKWFDPPIDVEKAQHLLVIDPPINHPRLLQTILEKKNAAVAILLIQNQAILNEHHCSLLSLTVEMEDFRPVLNALFQRPDYHRGKFREWQLIIENGQIDVMEACFEDGLITANHRIGTRSLFYYACAMGNRDMVELFIRFGADVKWFNHFNENGFHEALYNRDSNVFRLLVTNFGTPPLYGRYGDNILFQAEKRAFFNLDTFRVVLDLRLIDVNELDSGGNTLLHQMCCNYESRMLDLFLGEPDLDPRIRDSHGQTAWEKLNDFEGEIQEGKEVRLAKLRAIMDRRAL